MAIQVTISGTLYNIMEGSLTTDDTADGRSVAQFDVKDLTGALDFQQFQTVSIIDTVSGYTFNGEVNDSIKKPLAGTPAIIHTVSCVDGHTIPDKRYYAGPEYQNKYAGDIATDLLRILGPEGITAAYAVDTDQSIADWQQGALTNVVATNNISGGDLELALAGSAVTKTEQTTADFSAGTLTGLQSASNQLLLNSHASLSFSGSCANNFGNAFAYYQIWTGSYTIKAGDFLGYKVWINSGSPQIMAGVDGVCSDGTTFRDYNSNALIDQNGIIAHPKADLSGFANDQWYYRRIDISALAGKSLSFATLAFEGDNGGQYQAYFYDVQIENSAGVQQQNLYGSGGAIGGGIITQQVAVKVGVNGYSNVSITPVIAYESTGTRISPSVSIAAAGIYNSSQINWTQTLPANTSLAMFTSIDGGATWQAATTASAIAGLIAGASLAGKTIATKQVLSLTGKDPIASPVLTGVVWTVQPSYIATKSDTSAAYDTQAQWNTGTFTNNMIATAGGDLTPNNYLRNWDDASTANQTLFGASSPAMGTLKRQVWLRTGNLADVKARLDAAGTWTDFVVSIDIQITSANIWSGFEYRTTSWVNARDTHAYKVDVNTTSINLGKGTNGGAGGNTVLQTAALSLNAGDWHTLTVVVNGSQHTAYLDGVQYINFTDATYSAAGNVGIILNNSSGSTATGYFDNFGIVNAGQTTIYAPPPAANFPPTWTSPSISLGSIAVGNSIIEWSVDSPLGAHVTVLASVNGGTYQTCTNGAIIPGLTSGTVLTSGTLQLQIKLQAASPVVIPVFHGLSVWISSAFSSSGNRISEAISLAPVGKAGSTSISGSGIQPANTAIAVDTSLDGVSWTQVATPTPTAPGATSVTLSGSIAGITTQTDPVIDEFGNDSSINYTSTFATGGGLASWTWDTTHNRLSVSGGNQAVLLYNSPTTGADVDVSAVLDTADNAGFVWRFTDQSNFYYCSIHDVSNGVTPNALQLFKNVGGIRTQIGANAAISFTRGTPHVFRVVMTATALTISMDGVTIISTNDSSISAAGFAGVRNNASGGSAANYYALRIQFLGQDVTGLQFFTRVRLTSTDPTATPQLINLTASVRNPDIQSGALIPSTAYSIINGNKTTLAGIYDDLVKQSGNYWWKIVKNAVTDPSYRLLFQKLQSTPAPWVITGNDTLVSNLEIDNLNDHYRNSEWLTGGKDTTLQTYTFVGDERTTVFNLPYAVDSIVSMTINNVPAAYGIKGVDTGDILYWKQGDFSIVQDASLIPLNNTQTFVVQFYGIVDINVNIQNPSEIARVANLNNTTGIVEQADDGSGLNKAAMIIKGLGYLNQFAQTSKTAKFSTLRSGLAVGQLAPIFNVLGVFAGAFLIVGVKHSWKTTQQNGIAVLQPWYDVVAISGPIVGDWTRFVNNLAS